MRVELLASTNASQRTQGGRIPIFNVTWLMREMVTGSHASAVRQRLFVTSTGYVLIAMSFFAAVQVYQDVEGNFKNGKGCKF